MSDPIVQDIDGNIIGCKHCGSRDIRKFGFLYRANTKKQQWMCNNCGKRTVAPTILEQAEFVKQTADPEFMPIEELIEHRKKKYSIQIKARESKTLVDIDIKKSGPIGICHFGDPHIDDDGTNIAEIYSLCNLITYFAINFTFF